MINSKHNVKNLSKSWVRRFGKYLSGKVIWTSLGRTSLDNTRLVAKKWVLFTLIPNTKITLDKGFLELEMELEAPKN